MRLGSTVSYTILIIISIYIPLQQSMASLSGHYQKPTFSWVGIIIVRACEHAHLISTIVSMYTYLYCGYALDYAMYMGKLFAILTKILHM